MLQCQFCKDKDVKQRTIIENDFAFAFPTNSPIVHGHILICPKRHIKYYEDATQEEKVAIEDLRNKIKRALKKVFGAEGFNYAWNEEEIGGQSVPHLHLHVVPRKDGDQGIYGYEPRKFLYRPGPRAVAISHEELKKVIELVKKAL